jgi:hypothetical protein
MTGAFLIVALTVIATTGVARADEPAISSDDDLAAAATAGEVIVVTGTRSEVPLSGSPVVTDEAQADRLRDEDRRRHHDQARDPQVLRHRGHVGLVHPALAPL